jgi:hypothetical protein
LTITRSRWKTSGQHCNARGISLTGNVHAKLAISAEAGHANHADLAAEPPKLISWNVYKIASKAVWLGPGADEAAAIERAGCPFHR